MSWRPFTTAPRDGTEILAYRVGGLSRKMALIFWEADRCCWSSKRPDSDYSHWTPLPPAPNDREWVEGMNAKLDMLERKMRL